MLRVRSKHAQHPTRGGYCHVISMCREKKRRAGLSFSYGARSERSEKKWHLVIVDVVALRAVDVVARLAVAVAAVAVAALAAVDAVALAAAAAAVLVAAVVAPLAAAAVAAALPAVAAVAAVVAARTLSSSLTVTTVCLWPRARSTCW